MYSKNNLHLIESISPQKLKTIHKYSGMLISLLQRTTNQLTRIASTLEKPESFTARTYAKITYSNRISTIARISTFAKIHNRWNKLNAMSRAIYSYRLIRENSRLYKITCQTKICIKHARSDQMAQQTKNGLAKRNQHCDVTKRNGKSQNNPFLL